MSKLDGRLWTEKKNNSNNSLNYRININHQFIRNFVDIHNIKESAIESVLNTISDCLPVVKIIENHDFNPTAHDRALKQEKLDEYHLISAKVIYQDQKKKTSKSQAFSHLMGMEPYCYYEEQLKDYIK